MRLSPRLLTVLRRILLGVAITATVVAVFVAVENWRGDRAWDEIERELKARGEVMDFTALALAPVPDSENFFKAPVLAQLLYERPGDTGRKSFIAKTRLFDFHVLGEYPGRVKDISALRDRLKAVGLYSLPYSPSAAADVLQALEPLRPLLDEMSAAARSRPKARLEWPTDPLQYSTDANALVRIGQALAVKAAAQLELGQTEEAYADILTLLRLGEGLSTHPVNLVNFLVGSAVAGLAQNVITVGCERHAWEDTRLAELQRHVGELHLFDGLRSALQAERLMVCFAVDTRPIGAMAEIGWPPFLLFHGWAQQNKVAFCRHLESDIVSVFTSDPGRVSTHQLARGIQAVHELDKSHSPYQRISKLALKNLATLAEGVGKNADQLQLMVIACALERYRLARGNYPETLEKLTPTYLSILPAGVFDGPPPRFERMPGGGYLLYSLGQDGLDNHGTGDDAVITISAKT